MSGGIILTILGLCLGSSGVSGLVVACLQRHWAKRDKQEQQRDQKDDKLYAIVAAIKVLTLDRVKHLMVTLTGAIRRPCRTCTGPIRPWAATGIWIPPWRRWRNCPFTTRTERG